MKEIKPEELQKNPFQMIGKEWLLIIRLFSIIYA